MPFGCSRLKACRQRLIKSSPGPQPAVVMRKCNFLRGLLLVNLQAATLINTIQTNVSQHCHANINHSDISFLTSVLPLAHSQTRDEMERRRRRRREKKRGMRHNKSGERETLSVSKTGKSWCPPKRLMDWRKERRVIQHPLEKEWGKTNK